MFGKKIELCPTKAASQRTQFPDLTLKKYFISYRRLKTQKYSVSIRFPCSGFSFCEHFNRKLTYAFFFYIPNRKMCFSEKILHQYFVLFALLGAASPLKKCQSHYAALKI